MAVEKESKIIAKMSLSAFGGKPNVSKYWDDNVVSNVDILTAYNGFYKDVISYSTIGLSNYPIGYSVDGIPLRVEIVGASTRGIESYPNILATCAFNVINTKLRIKHGEVFNNVVDMYYPHIEMKHILFVTPFLWDKLQTIDFSNKKVAWLFALPISTNEYLFAEKNGVDALESLFEEKEIDVFNLKRASII